MKSHSVIGGELLGNDDSELMKLAQTIALTHHEKWDGSGYPNGLAGKEIPQAGRIVAVTDVFDALTSIRPYKKAWTVEDARAFIESNAGVQFDPEIVPHFLACLPEILAVRDRYSDVEAAPSV